MFGVRVGHVFVKATRRAPLFTERNRIGCRVLPVAAGWRVVLTPASPWHRHRRDVATPVYRSSVLTGVVVQVAAHHSCRCGAAMGTDVTAAGLQQVACGVPYEDLCDGFVGSPTSGVA